MVCGLQDEAYLETAPVDCIPLVSANDLRVLRLRTFSKGYGLAGARVGYALGAQVEHTALPPHCNAPAANISARFASSVWPQPVGA